MKRPYAIPILAVVVLLAATLACGSGTETPASTAVPTQPPPTGTPTPPPPGLGVRGHPVAPGRGDGGGAP